MEGEETVEGEGAAWRLDRSKSPHTYIIHLQFIALFLSTRAFFSVNRFLFTLVVKVISLVRVFAGFSPRWSLPFVTSKVQGPFFFLLSALSTLDRLVPSYSESTLSHTSSSSSHSSQHHILHTVPYLPYVVRYISF